MKKVLSFLAAFVLLGAFASQAFAAYSVVVPSGQTIYYYYNSSTQTITITCPGSSSSHPWDAYNKPTGALVIPDSITHNGTKYPVTSIGNYAFSDCSGLTSVTIGSGVTSIGYSAFYGCSGLTSVTIGSGVTSIGQYAFSGCSGLTSVTIPNSVTTIGNYAFKYCTSLTSVTIGSGVTSISNSAFYGCSGLTSLTIGSGVTSIGASAFSGCSGLTSVIFNADSCIGSTSYPVFDGCSNLTSITFGNNVKRIPSYLCNGCSGLTSVSIPNSVTSIGDYAFKNCGGLTSVTIGSGVTSIGNYAFYGCSGLTSVSIPNSVTSIGDYAFGHCSGLTSLTIGSGVTSIGNSAFYGCSGLTSVSIPNSVTSIGNYAFENCSGLTSVTIGSGVASIGVYAFIYCSSMDTVYMMPSTPPTLGDYAFANNASGRVFMIAGCGYDNYYNVSSSNPWYAYRSDLRTPTININVNVQSSNTARGTATVVMGLGNHTVRCDSTVVVQATANYGYHFDHWSNGSTANPDTVALSGDSTITAFFLPNSYTITGNSANLSRGTVTGSATVYYLDTVTLTAIANEHYHFDHWNGGNTSNPRQVIATGNMTLTAYFNPNQYQLTVNVDNPTHGSVSGGGTYNYNTSHTITATASTGYHFDHWSNGSTTASTSITLTGDSTVTAYFAINSYTITGTSANSALGTVTGSATVNYLETVTLTATANEHYHFDHWNDGNTSNPRQVTATGNITLTAYFVPDQHQLTVNVDNPARGTVSGGGTYDYNTSHTITATANYGYHFDHWSNGSTTASTSITLTGDTTITAYFLPNSYTVTGTSADNDRGTVTGSATVDYLDTVTLTATANYGYHIDHWTYTNENNNNTSTQTGGNTLTLVATRNRTATAYFTPNQYQLIVNVDDPIHGSVSGGGNYDYLTSHTITATASYGHHFDHWTGGSTDNPATVTLTGDTIITAYFERNSYDLTVNVNDASLGTVAFPLGSSALYQDTLMAVATPVEHYHVASWHGQGIVATSADKDTVWVAMSQNRTLTCTFAIDTHTVAVAANDIARGMVEATGTEFVYGSPCTVTATAYTGYTFQSWSNGVTANPYTFAVMEDVELTAIFLAPGEQSFTVTVSVNDPTMGSATVNGNTTATVTGGSEVTLTATPNEGYRFVRWNDDNTEETRTVTVTADMSFTAYFEAVQGIGGVDASNIKVYAADGRIVVEGTTEEVHVYDMMGRTMRNEALPTGVYMVKVGTLHAKKVVMIR